MVGFHEHDAELHGSI